MISKGFLAWILFCYQVNCRPLSSELAKEDEKVTRCIVEVISDTLSKPKPIPVSSECTKILKEDERILAMVRHQNLLKELEELAHHEETRDSSAKKKSLESDKKWNYPEEESVEWNEEDNMEKRHMLDKKGGIAERRDDVVSRGGANDKKDIPLKGEKDVEEYEESKETNMEERHEDKEVIKGEDDTKVVMHESEEEVSDEDKRSPEKRHRDASEEEARRAKEHEQEERDVLKLDKLIEKITKGELEDEEDKRDDEKKHHSKEYSSEEDNVYKRNEKDQGHVKKRVEENASDEETDQFEVEEKGIKILDSKTHLKETDGKHSPEKKWQDDKRRHHLEEDMDLKKRLDDDLDYLRKRHHDFENSEEQEEEEDEEEEEEKEKEEDERKLKHEEHKLKNLAEIEQELQEVAEKLRDIRRG